MRKAKQVSADSFYPLGNIYIKHILIFLVQKENAFWIKVHYYSKDSFLLANLIQPE